MKTKVIKILAGFGLDLSTANRIFYAKIIEQNGLPFAIKKEQETLWNPTRAEDKAFDRYLAEKSLAQVWNHPSEDIWDNHCKNAPSIDPV